MKTVLCIILSLCFILFCSCQDKTDTGLFLHGHEYKLWYIDAKDKDSLEWINLDTVKLKSFWTECEYDEKEEWEGTYQYGCESEYVYYIKTAKGTGLEMLRRFKKKRKAPEFLYMDRDGYACVLILDRKAGDFVEKQDAEMTGNWKMKNDSIIMINSNLYLFKKTGGKPNTVQLSNLKTDSVMEIIDANFPPALLNEPVIWTDEKDKEHYRKWGFGIKKSPVLQGYDYKLWRHEKNINFYKPQKFAFWSVDDEYFLRDYYYCYFIYCDKYGRSIALYLTNLSGNRWSMREYEELFCDGWLDCDDIITCGWHPEGNDAILHVCALDSFNDTIKISYSNKDTLHLHNLMINEDLPYIAVNLPPKSKNKKFKNR
ncbi:MAG: hypothetical protein LBG96_06880 [Tannerella sp.]|jgi:hypothetical protein|nr:hypothetical protein [Tannerella sp.]